MIHLLLKCNYTTKNWQGHIIYPGELITSIKNLSKELDLSENIIRNALKKLKTTKYILTQSTNKFTKIKITKSIIYNDKPISSNQPIEVPNTNKKQSNNKPITTTNKVNKEIEIKERIDIFKTQIFNFRNQFPMDVLQQFFKFWTEENKQTGRLRFEEEKFWNLETRLSNWKNYNTNSTNKKKIYTNR
ncbi:hypothetical protein [Flavobacterium sp. J27]|uniref:hypothetical protein n=1 Tax=Flavobacterium sp. J27 TaxID=2060419 RepID=UPI001031C029|nr:hypothetical protein [Flavobacterium sp. J27]